MTIEESVCDRAIAENEQSLDELAWAIEMSQGQFKLILARCNYASLRSQIVQQLRERSAVEIREIVLDRAIEKVYSQIREELGDEQPSAVMVLGLESVTEIDRVLTSLNQVREEFRKNCPFPLMLWIDDRVSRKLTRLAPDFESWGSLTEFAIAPNQLFETLQQLRDRVFPAILDAETERFLTNEEIFGDRYPLELNSALRDLEISGHQLTPDLEATLYFLRGRDAYVCDRIDEVLNLYQQSLAFWQHSNHLVGQGALLYHIGLCHCRNAELHRSERQSSCHWEKGHQDLQTCVDVFEKAQRPDLVAKFIGQLGEILQRLEQWDKLHELAQQSLTLHETHGNLVRLARDYGFLAEVALQRHDWHQANNFAKQALKILETDPKQQQHHQALYLLLLARSLRQLEKIQEAVACLENASNGEPQDNPQLYIEILQELRSLYYDLGQYLKAFQIKQKQRSIEQQYGFRAFIGAGCLEPQRQARSLPVKIESQATTSQEIIASGRQLDVDRLIERIGSTEHKLTVIYGQSGVGKSSLVNAGLVPALNSKVIGDRDVFPIALRVYTDWTRELGQCLTKALEEKGITLPEPPDSPETLLAQLQQNEHRQWLTVLIFDQFEEFFFVCREPSKRLKFIEFLGHCLNIPFVKVILSLREDYIHYLLVGNQSPNLSAIDNDILNKNHLYGLGNFSPTDAKYIIQSLTERAQFHLEPALIDEIVRDLASNFDSVRPIELQIVGAQLQRDNIRTLAAYREISPHPKTRLVEKYLEEVVQDCGPENQHNAELILYLLTGENNTRPLKTLTDLQRDFNALAVDLVTDSEQLNLILYVFVRSGLVFMLPEFPADRYQLVHDYLVGFVRDRQQQNIRELQEKLKRAIADKKRSQEELNQVLKRQLQAMFGVGILLTIFAGGAVGFAWQSQNLAKTIESEKKNAEELANNLQIEKKKVEDGAQQLQTERDRLLEFALKPESQLSQVLEGLINKANPENDYRPLKESLAQRNWEAADRATYEIMLKVAGEQSYEQGYFAPEEYKNFSCKDFQLIDDLWFVASGGTLGVSVQNAIYKQSGSNWEEMYERVGWRTADGKWLVREQYDKTKKWWVYLDWAQPKFANPPVGHLPIFQAIAVFEMPPMDVKGRKLQIQELLTRCQDKR